MIEILFWVYTYDLNLIDEEAQGGGAIGPQCVGLGAFLV